MRSEESLTLVPNSLISPEEDHKQRFSAVFTAVR